MVSLYPFGTEKAIQTVKPAVEIKLEVDGLRCKYCRRSIPDNSTFCNWCGKEQIRIRNIVSVPKPRRRADGSYFAQIMVDGTRYSVSGNTVEEYEANARAIKQKIIQAKKNPTDITLSVAEQKYIDANSAVLSPSTIRGYDMIRKHRFQAYSDKRLSDIDWQVMINEECALASPKTVRNAFAFVSASVRAVGFSLPDINLPAVPRNDLGWLDFDQIHLLVNSVKGKRIELPILLALHSLRLSEIIALTADDIYDGAIHVHAATVRDKDDVLVKKKTTKSLNSTRTIEIIIPRLKELLPSSGSIVDYSPNSIYAAINAACRAAGVPEVGVHGLRRSFASLGYHLGWSERSIMLVGGWSDIKTVHNIYVKLARQDVLADIKRMSDYYESG